jgi:inhibitor of cysteine peptidase
LIVRFSAGLFAAAWLAAAAAFGAVEPAEPRTEVRRVEIGESFDGGSLRLGRGDVLVVRLPPARSLAGPWTVAFGDSAILRPLGPPTIEDRTAVFRYVAAAPGGTSLGLAAVAPSDAAATSLFRVAVEVTAAPPRSRTLALSEADDGSRLYVAKGDVLTVRLSSNVTTGYGWFVSRSAPGVLQSAEPPSYQPPAASQPGAAGTQSFTIPVIGSGAGWLQVVYRRPFEKDTLPARSWSVFVAAADIGEPEPIDSAP